MQFLPRSTTQISHSDRLWMNKKQAAVISMLLPVIYFALLTLISQESDIPLSNVVSPKHGDGNAD